MKIDYIRIAGFRGISNEEWFHFSDGFTILTGRNGSGKSSVVDAIEFVVSGMITTFLPDTGFDKNINRHVWWEGEKKNSKQLVEICFENDDGEKFAITRERGNDEVSIEGNVEKFFKIDGNFEDWINLVIKNSIIRGETLASLDMKITNEAKGNLIHTLLADSTGSELTDRIHEIEKYLSENNLKKSERINGLAIELKNTLSNVTKQQKIKQQIINSINSINGIKIPKKSMSYFNNLLEKINETLDEYPKLEKKIEEYNSKKGNFDELDFDTKFDIDKLRNSAVRIRKLKTDDKSNTPASRLIENIIERIDYIVSINNEIKELIIKIDEKYNDIIQKIEYYCMDNIRDYFGILVEILKPSDNNEFESIPDSIVDNSVILRKEIDENYIDINRNLHYINMMKIMKFELDNLERETILERISTISPLLQEIYCRLKPHQHWTEIELDFNNEIQKSVNLNVNGGDMNYLFSSGQRKIAALTFMLGNFLSRKWVNWNTLIMDDPFEHLDQFGTYKLTEVISAIIREGHQVILAIESETLTKFTSRRLRNIKDMSGKIHELSTNTNGIIKIDEKEMQSWSEYMLIPGN